MRNALLYCRVSLLSQSNCRQISDLTEKASHYGMKVLNSFSDNISGSKDFFSRKGGSELMLFIENNPNITDIIVSEISRISRNVEDTKRVIRILSSKKINIHISNISMDTLDANGHTNPLVSLVTAVLGGVAEYERELLRERTRSGVAFARAAGKQIGRVETDVAVRVRGLLSSGTSPSETIKITGMSRTQVYKIRRDLKKK